MVGVWYFLFMVLSYILHVEVYVLLRIKQVPSSVMPQNLKLNVLRMVFFLRPSMINDAALSDMA